MSSINNNPWIDSGVDVTGLMSTSEALAQSNLDWEVRKQPVFVDYDGGKKKVDNHYANVRQTDGKTLGIFSKNYTVLQNRDAFTFFDNIFEKGDAFIERAGSFGKNNAKVWIQAKLPNYMRIGNTDDIIQKYVLLVNSHDGSTPIALKVIPHRLLCQNQLNATLKNKSDLIKVRHTKNLEINMYEAQKALGLVHRAYDEIEQVFNEMARVKLLTNDMNAYYNAVMNNGKKEVATRTKNNILDVKKVFEEGAGVDDPTLRGSLFHVYNAVTEYVDHHKSYNKNTDRLHATTFGSGERLKKKAYAEALKLVV